MCSFAGPMTGLKGSGLYPLLGQEPPQAGTNTLPTKRTPETRTRQMQPPTSSHSPFHRSDSVDCWLDELIAAMARYCATDLQKILYWSQEGLTMHWFTTTRYPRLLVVDA